MVKRAMRDAVRVARTLRAHGVGIARAALYTATERLPRIQSPLLSDSPGLSCYEYGNDAGNALVTAGRTSRRSAWLEHGPSRAATVSRQAEAHQGCFLVRERGSRREHSMKGGVRVGSEALRGLAAAARRGGGLSMQELDSTRTGHQCTPKGRPNRAAPRHCLSSFPSRLPCQRDIGPGHVKPCLPRYS
jgi:hypothetical protein